jgi:AcrR family transcriptional regulator
MRDQTTEVTDRPTGRDRRRDLVQIAYRRIASRGFEGLRVRDVAREAGINHATLLYYFPTKEALIQEVVRYLAQEFSINRAPGPSAAALNPLEELRREFADARYRVRAMPEMFVVLAELTVRARRDPAIARILHALFDGWREHLVSLLTRGVAKGAFRPDVDVEATARTIMAQLTAIGYQVLGPSGDVEVDRLVADLAAQTERWLSG